MYIHLIGVRERLHITMNSIERQDGLSEEDATTGETLVLGIGSVLRKDDGVGIVVIDRLREMELPKGVSLLDGGTAGIDLLGYLEGVSRLIIVDAMFADGNPGDILVLTGDELRDRDLFISGHYGRLSDILDMVGALWTRPETTIIGIVPKDVASYEMGLTPEVAGAVEKAVEMIKKMLSASPD